MFGHRVKILLVVLRVFFCFRFAFNFMHRMQLFAKLHINKFAYDTHFHCLFNLLNNGLCVYPLQRNVCSEAYSGSGRTFGDWDTLHATASDTKIAAADAADAVAVINYTAAELRTNERPSLHVYSALILGLLSGPFDSRSHACSFYFVS